MFDIPVYEGRYVRPSLPPPLPPSLSLPPSSVLSFLPLCPPPPTRPFPSFFILFGSISFQSSLPPSLPPSLLPSLPPFIHLNFILLLKKRNSCPPRLLTTPHTHFRSSSLPPSLSACSSPSTPSSPSSSPSRRRNNLHFLWHRNGEGGAGREGGQGGSRHCEYMYADQEAKQ